MLSAALILWAVLCTSAPSAHAQPAPPVQDEAGVKAAFLLRFVQYVEWPRDAFAQPAAPLVIGIAGADAIAAELSQMASSRAAQGRPVTVRPAKAGDDLTSMHILFIGSEDEAMIAQYVGAVRGRPVLVVTESPRSLEQGSMINFVIAERRVRFEIAPEAAERAGLTLSSRLLAVAMRIHRGELNVGSALARLFVR